MVLPLIVTVPFDMFIPLHVMEPVPVDVRLAMVLLPIVTFPVVEDKTPDIPAAHCMLFAVEVWPIKFPAVVPIFASPADILIPVKDEDEPVKLILRIVLF